MFYFRKKKVDVFQFGEKDVLSNSWFPSGRGTLTGVLKHVLMNKYCPIQERLPAKNASMI